MFSVFAKPDINKRGVGRIRDSKPETKLTVCITIENSPNRLSVYISLCKYRKKVFYYFKFINSLCQEKMQNSSLRHWLKEKFLPDAKSCTWSLACLISYCFAKKDAFENTDFSHLKCQLNRKQTSFWSENKGGPRPLLWISHCREWYGDLEPQWDYRNHENK